MAVDLLVLWLGGPMDDGADDCDGADDDCELTDDDERELSLDPAGDVLPACLDKRARVLLAGPLGLAWDNARVDDPGACWHLQLP